MKLVVTEFVSLDGVMEAPGGEPGFAHTGWVGDSMGQPQAQRFKLDEVLEADAHLLGRVTYESFAGAWPSREGEFADKINQMPKYVVSTTLKELEWENCHLIDRDVPEQIAALKARSGGTLLVAGSRTLVHALMAHGLVDEFRLLIAPVVLGSGRRLFPETPDKLGLKLVGSHVYDEGTVVLTYAA